MRILMIEPDSTVAEELRGALEDTHEVVVETDVAAGLARVSGSDWSDDSFELVICEGRAGELGRSDLVADLRALRQPPMIVFVVDSLEASDACLPDAVVSRPFAASELGSVLASMCARRATAKTRPLRRFPRGTT